MSQADTRIVGFTPLSFAEITSSEAIRLLPRRERGVLQKYYILTSDCDVYYVVDGKKCVGRLPKGFVSDGVTGGLELFDAFDPISWWFHDYIYRTHRATMLTGDDLPLTQKQADRLYGPVGLRTLLHVLRPFHPWQFSAVPVSPLASVQPLGPATLRPAQGLQEVATVWKVPVDAAASQPRRVPRTDLVVLGMMGAGLVFTVPRAFRWFVRK